MMDRAFVYLDDCLLTALFGEAWRGCCFYGAVFLLLAVNEPTMSPSRMLLGRLACFVRCLLLFLLPFLSLSLFSLSSLMDDVSCTYTCNMRLPFRLEDLGLPLSSLLFARDAFSLLCPWYRNKADTNKNSQRQYEINMPHLHPIMDPSSDSDNGTSSHLLSKSNRIHLSTTTRMDTPN